MLNVVKRWNFAQILKSSSSSSFWFPNAKPFSRSLSLTSIRSEASNRLVSQTDMIDTNSTIYLPEPPTGNTGALENTVAYNSLGEPTFSSLGLNSWYPSGWIQCLLEQFHVHLHLPWWACIGVSAISIRFLAFPIMIESRRFTVKVSDFLRVQHQLSCDLQKAEVMKDSVKLALVHRSLMDVQKDFPSLMNSFFQRFLPALLGQGVINYGLFSGLRGMANLPVQSLQTGGIGWFTDLTAVDPLMLLPTFTAFTIYLMIKIGMNSGSAQNPPPKAIKYGMLYGLPSVVLVVMSYSSSTLCFYWMISNTIATGQSFALRQEALKTYFNLPEEKFTKINERDVK